jgi:uncharacterized protein (DUF433 family)
MNWKEFIEQKSDVMNGKPVFKGTRLTVEAVLERLGDGWSEQELLASFPRLTGEQIRAACAFAAAALSSELTMIIAEPVT